MSVNRKVIDVSAPWQKACTGSQQPLLGFRLTRRGRRSSVPLEQREQTRRLKKQNMERRRRACISDKMTALHKLAMTLLGEDPSHYQKFEKADLLNVCYTVFESVVQLVKQQPDIHQHVQALTEQVRAQFSMSTDYDGHHVACSNKHFADDKCRWSTDASDGTDFPRLPDPTVSNDQSVAIHRNYPTARHGSQHQFLVPSDDCATAYFKVNHMLNRNEDTVSPSLAVENQSVDREDIPDLRPYPSTESFSNSTQLKPFTVKTVSRVGRVQDEAFHEPTTVNTCTNLQTRLTTYYGLPNSSESKIKAGTDAWTDHVWRPYLE